MKLTLVMAVDEHWQIGNKGDMLIYLSDDLKKFKERTMGGVLVMGRKTFLSLPNSKPLPGRRHVVVTRDETFQAEGVEVAHSFEDVASLLEDVSPDKIFLTGGGSLVTAWLSHVDTAYITMIHKVFPEADTRIPNLLEEGFHIDARSEMMYDENDDVHFEYLTLRRD